MGKFDGILICTDLDGTLLKDDKTVSSENKEAIEYFKRNGGYFTFVTGRMPYYAMDICDMVEPNVPFGCVNGGGLYDHVAKKYVYTIEISRDVLKLVDFIDESFPNVGIQINTFYHAYFRKENDVTANTIEVTGIPNLAWREEEIDEPLSNVLFCTECEEEMQGVMRALMEHPLADQFDFVRSEKALFEVLPHGIGKGVSLTRLAEYLNVDIGKTVAIGDYNNDISMLKAAGVGIAVANASKEAKAAADIITVSNEEHAIAKVIYGLEESWLSYRG